jgi:hypothetical protein
MYIWPLWAAAHQHPDTMLATRTKIQRNQTAVVFRCVFWRLTEEVETGEYPLYMDGVAFSPSL